jgi:tRNA-specific 2-thiouridylase
MTQMNASFSLEASLDNYQVVKPPARVVIGMSGGVDSSVAAWLLKQQGYEVIGLFMKNWEDDDDSEYCSTRQDWLDVASVADIIGIDVEAVNFAAEYKDRVFAEFLKEYSAGRTPNPDVLCNAEIKFKAFLDHAMRLGATAIATGHYARVRKNELGEVELLKAIDASKDQSYFLHRLNQQQLSRVMFPLGGLPKTKIRELAEQIGLPNAKKKDSTGICFIGERPFREFLGRYLPTKPGPMITPEGKRVGEHIGLAFYTLGQRKGIGLGGSKQGSGDAWYVGAKDLKNNTLIVVQGHEHPLLKGMSLYAADASWVSGRPPTQLEKVYAAKTRYRQADSPCEISYSDLDHPEIEFRLNFKDPQWAMTPGQSAVLYQGDICLGGGIIV